MQKSEKIAAELTEWAAGYKPEKAAVEFLLNSDDLFWDTAGYCLRTDGRNDGKAWIDWDALTDERIGGASGGTYSMYKLALSIRKGEIDSYFWRLDGSRQKAFIEALIHHR